MKLSSSSILLICLILFSKQGSLSAQSCDPPEIPVIIELLDASIIIAWEASDDAMLWDIDYGPAPHTPSEFGLFYTNSVQENAAYTITELYPDENFELYIRTDCTINPDIPTTSDWVGPLSFSTFVDICQFPEYLAECEDSQLQFDFPSDLYPVACPSASEGSNWMIEFTPTLSNPFFLHSSELLSSVMIREKRVCDELDWLCMLDGSTANSYPIGDLEMEKAYQILIRADGFPQVNIGQCAVHNFNDYVLESTDFDLMNLDFNFTQDGSSFEGEYDLFVAEESILTLDANSAPSYSSYSIFDGKISVPANDWLDDTKYNIYFRSVCSGMNGCWEGPFEFRTPINCGAAPPAIDIQVNSINAILTFEVNFSQYWKVEFGAAPFAEPDPLASGNSNILDFTPGPVDSVKYTLLGLEAFTTYQFYLKRECSDSPIDIANQAWYGPYEFTTNGNCFVDVQDLNCGQCYASIPAYGHDYFEENYFCDNDDAPSRGERIFRIQRPSAGEVSLKRDLTSSEPFESIIYQFYLKPASEACDVADWTYLGCWVGGGGDGDIVIEVEANEAYHLMIDYQTESTFAYNYHRFEFLADDCENACPPVENLSFAPINSEHVLLNWNAEPGAIGYDIVSVPSGGSPNPNPCLYQYTSLFEAILHPDTFYLASELSLNEPQDFYVRSRCTELNYSPWTMIEVEPQEGQESFFSNVGTLQYCSPYYVLDGQAISYDQLSFRVAEDGWYQLYQEIEASSYLRLYEANFDPEFPEQNLLASVANNFVFANEASLWFDFEAGQNYVVVSSAQAGMVPSELIELTITGSGEVSSAGYEFLGVAEGAGGVVPETNGSEYVSNQVCIDVDGWRHYYEVSGTGLDMNRDALLFSIMDYPEINIPMGMETLTISGNAGTSLINNTPENYVAQPEGWITMNRFWDLTLADAQQPVDPLAVRFYYTEADFQAMADALPSSSEIDHNDLSFYKINQNTQGFNTNPADGHLDIPLAEHCADEGYWEYAFASQADTISWTYGMHENAHYAEMVIHEFSGGGGGVGSAVNIINQSEEIIRIQKEKYSVYPNPIHQEIFIQNKINESLPTRIECFDVNGHLVYSEPKKIGNDLLSINTTSWPTGIYFIKILDDKAYQIEMLIKN